MDQGNAPSDEHTHDTDCTPDQHTGTCDVCGVEHGDPCGTCGATAFHRPGCRHTIY